MSRAFRFAPLLDLAEQREEQQTLDLASAVGVERAAQLELARLDAEREHQWVQFGTAAGPMDAEQYRAALAYIERLTERIAEQQRVLVEAQDRVAEARDALLETVKERRSLEHLKDRDHATATREEDRREAGRQDDLNMSRHARRTADGRTGAA